MSKLNLSNRISNEKTDIGKSSNWRSDIENTPLSGIFESALSGETCHILLVEDHLMSQMLAKRFLLKCGYTVDAVSDGKEAIEKAAMTKYDIILMDLNLPEIDGFEATKVIRAMENFNAATPILALTNSSEYNIREKTYAFGMNDYISKPFNPKELFQKVKHYAFI